LRRTSIYNIHHQHSEYCLTLHASQSIDNIVGQAVDFVVYKIDSLPKEQEELKGTPSVHAPDWPQVREGFIEKVKSRLEAFFFQLEKGMLATIDPKLFESQARREASEVVFGTVL
jgi:hypothetical protein